MVSDEAGRVGVEGFRGTYRLTVDGRTATVDLTAPGDLAATPA